MPTTTNAHARVAVAAVVLLILTSGAVGRGGTVSTEAALRSGGAPAADNWPTYGGNLYNSLLFCFRQEHVALSSGLWHC